MSETSGGDESTPQETYLFGDKLLEPGDPVVVLKIYAGSDAQFQDVATREAFFDGCRPAVTPQGDSMFDARPVPHLVVIMQDEAGDYGLELRGFECDWTVPAEYEAALDAVVARYPVPDYIAE
jgi:hypothetical protein